MFAIIYTEQMFRRDVRRYRKGGNEMTYMIDFSDMTDRELRIYKNAIRKRRALRLKCMKLFFTFFIAFIGFIIVQSVSDKAYAADDSLMHSYKYYTQITIEKGDTLWSIAEDYADEFHYDTLNDYVKEVCAINHCKADHIVSGQSLILPYYSNEFIY